MTELLLKEYTATSCVGQGRVATLEALLAQRGGLAPCTFERAEIDT
jgi:3-oxoacyl-[acyl-carrier-protein] synthase I